MAAITAALIKQVREDTARHARRQEGSDRSRSDVARAKEIIRGQGYRRSRQA
mgnify:CR=1 FL=1